MGHLAQASGSSATEASVNVRNFCYEELRECFIGGTPEVSGGRVGLENIDLEKSFKVSIRIDCDEVITNQNYGTVWDIRDKEESRSGGSSFDPFKKRKKSKENSRMSTAAKPFTQVYRHAEFTGISIFNGPGTTLTN